MRALDTSDVGRTLRVGIHRDNRALAFQEVAEPDDRARFLFVMVERRLDVCMTAQSDKAFCFELTCTDCPAL